MLCVLLKNFAAQIVATLLKLFFIGWQRGSAKQRGSNVIQGTLQDQRHWDRPWKDMKAHTAQKDIRVTKRSAVWYVIKLDIDNIHRCFPYCFPVDESGSKLVIPIQFYIYLEKRISRINLVIKYSDVMYQNVKLYYKSWSCTFKVVRTPHHIERLILSEIHLYHFPKSTYFVRHELITKEL